MIATELVTAYVDGLLKLAGGSAGLAATFTVSRIDAGKQGFGYRQRADRGRWR